ncbi:hypothetical protein Lrub_1069 [Legionella rubrilucens]|uniref:Uncharacterized protein n=2 Tax=Legionella rubrilucens TaxID=458 RepID=A0A0W0XWQ0_9GAMM|nr:hypothetical protein Lrub_1069 [Legionella rubrilucens]
MLYRKGMINPIVPFFFLKAGGFMKRSFWLLLALPVLSSCGIEDDYYMNDYRYPPPQARVETPYYSAPYESGPGHYHGHQSSYRRYHGHYGNNNPVIVQAPRNYRPRGPANVHGHSSQAQPGGNTHGHPSQNQAGNTHGHPDENQGGNTHGHPSQNQADNTHGHPSQGGVRSSRGRAWNPYGSYQPQAANTAQGQANQAVVTPANDNRVNTIYGHD